MARTLMFTSGTLQGSGFGARDRDDLIERIDNNFELVADAIDRVLTTDDNIVYASTSGSDSAVGSVSNPILSIKEYFENRHPSSWKGKQVLRLASGSFAWTATTGTPDPTVGAYVGEKGTPFLIEGEEYNVINELTCSAGAASYIERQELSLSQNYLFSTTLKTFVEITSGTGSGQRRMVVGNNATQIFVNSPFSPVPVSGSSVFKVTTPSSEISLPSFVVFNYCVNGFALKNVKIKINGGTFGVTDGSRIVGIEGVIVDCGGGFMILRRQGNINPSGGPGTFSGGSDNPFSSTKTAAGVHMVNGTFRCDISSAAVGLFATLDRMTAICQDARLTFTSPYAVSSSFTVQRGSLEFAGNTSFTTFLRSQKTSDSTRGVVNVFDDGVVTFGTGRIDINDSGGHGVYVDSFGKINGLGSSATAVVAGSGNLGIGVYLDCNARGHSTGSAVPLISGALGALKVGVSGATDWSSLYAGPMPVSANSPSVGSIFVIK